MSQALRHTNHVTGRQRYMQTNADENTQGERVQSTNVAILCCGGVVQMWSVCRAGVLIIESAGNYTFIQSMNVEIISISIIYRYFPRCSTLSFAQGSQKNGADWLKRIGFPGKLSCLWRYRSGSIKTYHDPQPIWIIVSSRQVQLHIKSK